MICPRCGFSLDANQRSCPRCGFVVVASSSQNLYSGGRQSRQAEPKPHEATRQAAGDTISGPGRAGNASYLNQRPPQVRQDPPSLRANRVISNPAGEQTRQAVSLAAPAHDSGASLEPGTQAAIEGSTFSAGSLVGRGRYRLLEPYSIQRWANKAYEAHWRARDTQGEANVIICEMDLPDLKTVAKQTNLRAAMRALSLITLSPHVLPLIDVLRDSGRDLFVFKGIEGESLAARLQRTKQPLSEQEAVECCTQIAEVLEQIAQQSPSLVHGLVSLEHIWLGRNGRWYLTDFSVVLASGATQYAAGLAPSSLPPFSAPEVAQGMIDSRSDIYALLATLFYAVTGKQPRGQNVSAAVSPTLQTIFTKGLQPNANQRYQKPSALLQDLMALHPGAAPTSLPGSLQSMPGLGEVNGIPASSLNGTSRGERRWQAEQEPGYIGALNSNPFAASGPRQVIGSVVPASQPAPLSNSVRPIDRRAEQTNWARQPAQPLARQATLDPLAQAFSSLPLPDQEILGQQQRLLPRPEELPPLPPANEKLAATLWMIAILAGFLILVVLELVLK